jgi:hypothetical protein
MALVEPAMNTTEPKYAHAGDLEVSFRDRAVVRPLYLDPEEARRFHEWLLVMRRTGVPYALGGAYAHYAYTGVWRDSKDMDVFVRPQDVRRLLDAFEAAGYDTELRDPRWLAKVHSPPHLLDILFAVRHMTRLRIDDEWLRTAAAAKFLGVPTRILRPEEIIATKVYIANRDRFDGADILHLIRAVQGEVDWQRLIDLLQGDEEIVLWHLVLFAFVYPMHREWLPRELMQRAFERLQGTPEVLGARAFRGSVLDPISFRVDVGEWGYRDAGAAPPLLDREGRPL